MHGLTLCKENSETCTYVYRETIYVVVCRTIIFVVGIHSARVTLSLLPTGKYYFRWQKCVFLVLFCLCEKENPPRKKNRGFGVGTQNVYHWTDLPDTYSYCIVSWNPFVFLFDTKLILCLRLKEKKNERRKSVNWMEIYWYFALI